MISYYILLKQLSRPKCEINEEIVPDFQEINVDVDSLPYLSHDGVFVHEMKYYRPGIKNKRTLSLSLLWGDDSTDLSS